MAKCARPNGHGHNYHLEVTVKGEVDPQTGMIVDLEGLQRVIDDHVVEPFDHTFLNKDIPYFLKLYQRRKILRFISEIYCKKPIQDLGAQLHKIKLIESPNNSCEVYCTNTESESTISQIKQPVLARV
jgi:6-pyruvoyl-tetrahydropterin synthase